MMRYVTIAVLWFLALGSTAHAQEDHVALLKNVSGNISIVRHDATVPAASGMVLFVSDRLISLAGASAGVVFRDGTLVTLGPSADLELRQYVFKPDQAQYAFDVYLTKGSAIYSSGKIGKLAPAAVKVGTPTATVGVRGTRFLIEAE